MGQIELSETIKDYDFKMKWDKKRNVFILHLKKGSKIKQEEIEQILKESK